VTSHYDQYSTPGRNDLVQKYAAAHEAFMDWNFAGKPRQGPEFFATQRTRAAFKLSLRYCKQHEEELLADQLATNLMDKQFDTFWSSIRKCNNCKAAATVNTVGGCVGDVDISEMRKNILMFFIIQLLTMEQRTLSCNVLLKLLISMTRI